MEEFINVRNYLIDQDGHDWGEILSDWVPPLPETLTIWLVSRFGDLFVLLEDDSVWMLDILAGSFRRIADNTDHFADLIDEGNNANEWLMIPLVDACVKSGMTLRPDQCYGFKHHPRLGGKYAVDNVEPSGLAVYYSLMGQINSQLRDVPDGTKVRMVRMVPPDSKKAISET